MPTEEEIRRYYQAVWQARRGGGVVLIKTLPYTGVRVAELVAIRLVEVDLDACRIRITNGKGGKDRTVPFPPTFALHVDARRKAGGDHLFESGWKLGLGGWLVGAGCLGRLRLGLGLVDGSRRVVRWPVDGVQAGRNQTDVGEVVLGPGRYDHDLAGPNLLPGVAQLGQDQSLDKREELVVVLVDLCADVLPRCERHDDQL